MQSKPNGALRHTVKAPPPVMMAVDTQADDDFDIETFDLSAFTPSFTSNQSLVVRPSDKQKRDPVVDRFVQEALDLYQEGNRYQVEVVERGNQHLYDMLAAVYSIATRIEQQSQAKEILAAIRADFKEKTGVSIRTDATAINVMARFVIRADKSSASRYAQVLEVCKEEDLAAEDIPAYLKRRGGVSKIRDIEARQLAAKEGESTSKKRMKVLRDFMKWTAIASKDAFDYDQQVWQHRSADQSEDESGEFVVFLTKYDAGRGDYKVAGAYDLGKGREDAVLKILLAQFRQDVPVLEAGLRNFKKKLAQDPSMPEATKKLLLETNRDLLPDADREAIEVQATITTKKSR
jgi:RNA binding exosome subunit